MNNRGLTLVELLVALVIIMLVSAIAIINIISTIEKARQKATMSDMRTISRALETYNIDNGYYPRNGLNMEELREVLVPYSSSVLPVEDAWRNPFSYSTNVVDSYTLISYGKDGIDGDDISYETRFDFDKDIVMYNGTFMARPVE
ncbi:MAG: type II secretion system protein GspG [Acidobacteriota bacterium]